MYSFHNICSTSFFLLRQNGSYQDNLFSNILYEVYSTFDSVQDGREKDASGSILCLCNFLCVCKLQFWRNGKKIPSFLHNYLYEEGFHSFFHERDLHFYIRIEEMKQIANWWLVITIRTRWMLSSVSSDEKSNI